MKEPIPEAPPTKPDPAIVRHLFDLALNGTGHSSVLAAIYLLKAIK